MPYSVECTHPDHQTAEERIIHPGNPDNVIVDRLVRAPFHLQCGAHVQDTDIHCSDRALARVHAGLLAQPYSHEAALVDRIIRLQIHHADLRAGGTPLPG